MSGEGFVSVSKVFEKKGLLIKCGLVATCLDSNFTLILDLTEMTGGRPTMRHFSQVTSF